MMAALGLITGLLIIIVIKLNDIIEILKEKNYNGKR